MKKYQMDFARQTSLAEANLHFTRCMEQVYVNDKDKVFPFIDLAHNPSGGQCYCLSSWALMGLRPTDHLVRGTIIPDKQPQKQYPSGWVVFNFEGQPYIYDPLQPMIYPKDIWEDRNQPTDITFDQTQQEILAVILQENSAYQFTDTEWHLKSRKLFPKEYTNVTSGFLSSDLGLSQIRVFNGETRFFLANHNI